MDGEQGQSAKGEAQSANGEGNEAKTNDQIPMTNEGLKSVGKLLRSAKAVVDRGGDPATVGLQEQVLGLFRGLTGGTPWIGPGASES